MSTASVALAARIRQEFDDVPGAVATAHDHTNLWQYTSGVIQADRQQRAVPGDYITQQAVRDPNVPVQPGDDPLIYDQAVGIACRYCADARLRERFGLTALTPAQITAAREIFALVSNLIQAQASGGHNSRSASRLILAQLQQAG